jgi:hypothetical protein
MGFTIDFSVLNQKGTPALYSDIFANRPAAGYQGRLFIATDTAAIYEDTGTAWTLIANVSSGAGTLQQVTTNGNTSNVGISVTAGGVSTNSLTDTSLTTGSVPFAGAGGLISQDNANLFWDDTNNRLGINTNTPGNSLDVHTAGTNPTIAVNNTAGNQSAVSFLKSSVAKWRIGNTATDTFDIYNFALGQLALTIDGSNNFFKFLKSIMISQGAGFSPEAGYNGIGGDAGGFFFNLGTNTFSAYLNFIGLTGGRTFTFPDTSGTVALTSNLSSYLPLTGGNLTGNITVSVNTGLSALTLNNASLSGRNWSFINVTNGADTDLQFFNSGTSGGTKVTFTATGRVGFGTTNPQRQFVISDPSGNGLEFSNSAGYSSLLAYNRTTSTYQNIVLGEGTNRILIGTNTDDTVNKLQVNGSANFAASNISTTNSYNRSVNVGLPGSATTTVLRFLNNAGTLSGQNAIFGILNIYIGWNAGYNFGSNVYAYSISCSSNGVGVLTLLSSNIVGSNLVTSVAAVADGTGCKIDITTNAVANALGANCLVVFNGNYF